MGRRRIPFEEAKEKFWSYVDKTPGLGPNGDCWMWSGRMDKAGYGMYNLVGRGIGAHRASLIFAVGPLEKDIHACHKCDNPGCVRPDHLFPGTMSDNIRDMVAKGRQWQMKKTHCKYGHEYSPENTRPKILALTKMAGAFVRPVKASCIGLQ